MSTITHNKDFSDFQIAKLNRSTGDVIRVFRYTLADRVRFIMGLSHHQVETDIIISDGKTHLTIDNILTMCEYTYNHIKQKFNAPFYPINMDEFQTLFNATSIAESRFIESLVSAGVYINPNDYTDIVLRLLSSEPITRDEEYAKSVLEALDKDETTLSKVKQKDVQTAKEVIESIKQIIRDTVKL